MAVFRPHFRLADMIEAHELDWDVATVGELIERGTQEFGEGFGKEMKQATILVNGRAIAHLQGKKTPLNKEDEVWTVLPAAGG